MPARTRVVGHGEESVTYDVHGDLGAASAEQPVLLVVGSPMAAVAFEPLVAALGERPVVTIDPRGAGRNPAGQAPLTPAQHAADLHAVVADLDVGPVDVFATSGGAVNALAHAAAYGEQVRIVVAHEPPALDLLPDRGVALAACAAVVAAYEREGEGAAMARFIELVTHDGELDAAFLDRPAPDPARYGQAATDDGSRRHPLMRNLVAGTSWPVPVADLATLGERVVLAAGADSGETIAARAARSVAAALGREAVALPGDHVGFLSEPAGFAAGLRPLLAGRA